MSGQLLRQGSGPRHSCEVPGRGTEGDVWRCACGRRWTCLHGDRFLDLADEHKGPVFEPYHQVAVWERRWWPWPRSTS